MILEWLIERKKIVALFFAMLVFAGAISLAQLPRREIPEVELPLATITTIYPGAQAEEVEQYVTNKLEQEIRSVSGIKLITSSSRTNLSSVIIELDNTVDAQQVWNVVRQRINNASTSFPEGVEAPIFNDDLSMQGVSFYHILADDKDQLLSISSTLERWEQSLLNLPGVANVVYQGLPELELVIELQPAQLERLQIAPALVRAVIAGEKALPTGEWVYGERTYQTLLTTADSTEQLQKLAIAERQGKTVYLSDVAKVSVQYKPEREFVKYGDKLAVTMTVFIVDGSDIPAIDRQVSDLLASLEQELPLGIELKKVYSQAEPVQELFRALTIAFIQAFFSVLVVCTLGLSLLTSISVALAIPISLSVGLIVLPYTIVDMNQITLIAIIIVLGILVDDAIVVNENIDRRLRLGENSLQAAINGTKEVATSVITSTLTIVFTFFPLLFLSGAEGAFVVPLPVVIISAIIASTLVALTLLPIFRAITGKDTKPQFKSLDDSQQNASKQPEKSIGLIGFVFDWLADKYSRYILKPVTKIPVIVTIVGFVVGFSAYALVMFIPFEFFPDTDREELFLEAQYPVGMSIEAIKTDALQIEDWIGEQAWVKEVTTFVGTGVPRLFGMTGSAAGSSTVVNFLMYVDKEQVVASEIADQWNDNLAQMFPKPQLTAQVVISGPPVGAPIAIQVSGDSMEVIGELVEQVKTVLSRTRGVASISDDAGRMLPTVVFQQERETMARWGVNNQRVSEELRLLGEGLPLGEWSLDGDLVDTRMLYADASLTDVVLVLDGGNTLALRSLVTQDTGYTMQNIPHRNLVPTVTVRAFPSERTANEIAREVREELLALTDNLPGYKINIGGEVQAQTDFFIEIGKLFVVVIFLVLIVMAIQFYSLIIPFMLLSTVSLSVSGALIGLFLTKTPLGFMAIMGIVSLAGVVTRNGIVLIEFIRQRMEQGIELAEAVQLAGVARLRPILLTTMTSIAGLIPILLTGNPLFEPLAIAIISGLLFSAVLTLVVVPANYIVYEKVINFRFKKV